MTVLEIIAEEKLGAQNLACRPSLRSALRRIDAAMRQSAVSEEERSRVASVVDLCWTYERETDEEERQNILRTIEEIAVNEPLELPTETLEEWENTLVSRDAAFAEAKAAVDRRREFQKRYFSLRARAGLQTQEAVARRAGLRRSYVAVIESGAHVPQQKTLQKLARAFEVDVAELLT